MKFMFALFASVVMSAVCSRELQQRSTSAADCCASITYEVSVILIATDSHGCTAVGQQLGIPAYASVDPQDNPVCLAPVSSTCAQVEADYDLSACDRDQTQYATDAYESLDTGNHLH